MSTTFDEDRVKAALDQCASEPVHIPGTIQPAGYLMAIHAQKGRIDYISENAGEVFDQTPQDLLGTAADEFLDQEVWHSINNAMSFPSFATVRELIDTVQLRGASYNISGFLSGDHIVLELQKSDDSEVEHATLRQLAYLTREIQTCEIEQDLLDLNTTLMRRLTGFDRVMAYKFDIEHAGEVVSESLKGNDESFLGLRFPSWDIPAQARAIMCKLPLRIIVDTHQTPIPILASPGLPPLDITLAQLRGISEVHMQYLRNMDLKSTMTLSIVVDDRLWGMISFHAKRPKMPTLQQQQLLIALKPILEVKLSALLLKEHLKLSASLEALRESLQPNLEADDPVVMALSSFAPKLLTAFRAEGVAVITDVHRTQYGQVPQDSAIKAILGHTRDTDDQVVTCENFVERFPDLSDAANGIGGYLAINVRQDETILIFKVAKEQKIRWAGAPEKSFEIDSGQTRLEPRGSFSLYLESIKDRCEAWDRKQLSLVGPLCSWLRSSEALAQSKTIGRQQDLVIDELNHRVRNILALIRSVSRQARQMDGENYAEAMESRILTLTEAHDLAVKSPTGAAWFHDVVAVETKPYDNVNHSVALDGPKFAIRADWGPIMVLIVHELVTNAAKYGAFSQPAGVVKIQILREKTGVVVVWKETGGPRVETPKRQGFGTKLIEKAVPHELGGTASLAYEPDGLKATIWLPAMIIEDQPEGETQSAPNAPDPKSPQSFSLSAAILIVEDNYILSLDLYDILSEMGFSNIEIAARAGQAMDLMETSLPDLAILDVKLRSGETTFDIARHLLKNGVPFVFATGYGSQGTIPPELSEIKILTKPLSTPELKRALSDLKTS